MKEDTNLKPVALRYNSNKTRYDLLEPYALEQLAKVFTKGAEKYAPYNWMKGMEWSKMVASLKRHLAAFEQGEDFDKESGLYHMAHCAWNAMGIVSYYKHRPEFDDRQHSYLQTKKIGLDIDEVIADWLPDWCNYWGLDVPNCWYFDRDIKGKFEKMIAANKLDGFYLNLKPLIKPIDIPFEPHCYVTSRPVDTAITEKWLDMHGFPARPVITVPLGTSKAGALKEAGVDIFVDDRYDNFVELNKAGICTYLFDHAHNHRYDVGYKRIYSLKDLI